MSANRSRTLYVVKSTDSGEARGTPPTPDMTLPILRPPSRAPRGSARRELRGDQFGDLCRVQRRTLAQVVAADEHLDGVRVIKRPAYPSHPGRVGANHVGWRRELAALRVVVQHHAWRLAQHPLCAFPGDLAAEHRMHGHRVGGDDGDPDTGHGHLKVGHAEDLS